MNYKRLLLASVLVISVTGLQAKEPSDCKEYVRLSISGAPLCAYDYFSEGTIFTSYDYYVGWYGSDLAGIYRDYKGPVNCTGLISAEYSARLWNHASLGVSLGISSLWYSEYNGITEELKGEKKGTAVYVVPVFRHYLLDKNRFKLYWSLSVGIGKYFGFDQLKGWRIDYYGRKYYEDNTFRMEGQLVPIGLEYNWDKIAVFMEYGVGTQFIGGGVGVSYKF